MERAEQTLNQENPKSGSPGGDSFYNMLPGDQLHDTGFPTAALGAAPTPGGAGGDVGIDKLSHTVPTVAFTNELLVLPARVCNNLKQLDGLLLVLLLDLLQCKYFQECQDPPDLKEFYKVSIAVQKDRKTEIRHWSGALALNLSKGSQGPFSICSIHPGSVHGERDTIF